jgi:hypothetical protein
VLLPAALEDVKEVVTDGSVHEALPCEALTGARAGWVTEPRHNVSRGADAVEMVGRQHRWQRFRGAGSGPPEASQTLPGAGTAVAGSAASRSTWAPRSTACRPAATTFVELRRGRARR